MFYSKGFIVMMNLDSNLQRFGIRFYSTSVSFLLNIMMKSLMSKYNHQDFFLHFHMDWF